MSINLSNAARTLFDDSYKAAYESMGPDLRPYVTFRSQAGVDVYKFRTMGRGIAKSRGPSQSQLDTLGVAHSTVNCTLENWYASELTDVFDQDKTNAPQEVPALAKVLANSIKRRETQLVIDAMKNAVGSLPPANVIFEDPSTPSGGSNEVGLTVDKLLRARRALKANDIMETPTLLLTEKQEADLLALTQFTSSDFTANVGAETGNIRQGHFGFNYILVGSGRDEDGLPYGVTGGGTNVTTDNRRIFAFVPSAVGLVVGLNKTEVNYESAAASWRSTAMLRAGACVIDPKGVVSIICDEN